MQDRAERRALVSSARAAGQSRLLEVRTARTPAPYWRSVHAGHQVEHVRPATRPRRSRSWSQSSWSIMHVGVVRHGEPVERSGRGSSTREPYVSTSSGAACRGASPGPAARPARPRPAAARPPVQLAVAPRSARSASHGSSPAPRGAVHQGEHRLGHRARGPRCRLTGPTAALVSGSSRTVRGVASAAPSRSSVGRAASGCTIRSPSGVSRARRRPRPRRVPPRSRMSCRAARGPDGRRRAAPAARPATRGRRPAAPRRASATTRVPRLDRLTGQQVHDLGQLDPAHAERAHRRVPGGPPGGQQAGDESAITASSSPAPGHGGLPAGDDQPSSCGSLAGCSTCHSASGS